MPILNCVNTSTNILNKIALSQLKIS